jgi:hypothetical protein
MVMAKTEPLRQRKRRKKGNLAQLRGVLWMSLLELETLAASGDADVQIKACNALAALSRAYLTCIDVSDIESRLQELEGWKATMHPHANGRYHATIPR